VSQLYIRHRLREEVSRDPGAQRGFRTETPILVVVRGGVTTGVILHCSYSTRIVCKHWLAMQTAPRHPTPANALLTDGQHYSTTFRCDAEWHLKRAYAFSARFNLSGGRCPPAAAVQVFESPIPLNDAPRCRAIACSARWSENRVPHRRKKVPIYGGRSGSLCNTALPYVSLHLYRALGGEVKTGVFWTGRCCPRTADVVIMRSAWGASLFGDSNRRDLSKAPSFASEPRAVFKEPSRGSLQLQLLSNGRLLFPSEQSATDLGFIRPIAGCLAALDLNQSI
jgi:hypothetical protein